MLTPPSSALRVSPTSLSPSTFRSAQDDLMVYCSGADMVNSIQNASTNVLETILCHDTCDVDIRNRNGDTPLHVAVRNRWEGHEGLRRYLGASFCNRDNWGTAAGLAVCPRGAEQV